MKRRFDLWMADWRDAQGKRHRKGCPTKKGALRHQEKMQRQARAKKPAPRRRRRPLRRVGRGARRLAPKALPNRRPRSKANPRATRAQTAKRDALGQLRQPRKAKPAPSTAWLKVCYLRLRARAIGNVAGIDGLHVGPKSRFS